MPLVILCIALFFYWNTREQSLLPLEGNGQYYTDGTHVFYRTELMKEADLSSFVDLNIDGYAKDANHVYRFCSIVADADPQSFQPLHGDYAKDDHFIFFAFHIVKEADLDSFEVLKCQWKQVLNQGSHYAKDRSHAYVRGTVVGDVSPETFFFENINCEDIPY
ncbi:MAG: DKNYY domain-containing protein [Candidatus Peribacteraceae bacterium]